MPAVTRNPELGSAFALHVVTDGWAGGDLSQSLSMTGAISRVFREVEQTWGARIDQSSMSAARFDTVANSPLAQSWRSRPGAPARAASVDGQSRRELVENSRRPRVANRYEGL